MADIETLAADTRVFSEGDAAATPGAGTVVVYAKADGKLYSKDDAGAETLVSGGAGGGGSASFVGARATKSAEQSNIAQNSDVKVTFNGTAFDTDSIFNDANDRMVIPAGKAGYWRVSGNCTLAQVANDSDTFMWVADGTDLRYFYRQNPNDPNVCASFSFIYNLAEAAYIELYVRTAGTTTDIREGIWTSLEVQYLGPSA